MLILFKAVEEIRTLLKQGYEPRVVPTAQQIKKKNLIFFLIILFKL